jgi:hypothetical protein
MKTRTAFCQPGRRKWGKYSKTKQSKITVKLVVLRFGGSRIRVNVMDLCLKGEEGKMVTLFIQQMPNIPPPSLHCLNVVHRVLVKFVCAMEGRFVDKAFKSPIGRWPFRPCAIRVKAMLENWQRENGLWGMENIGKLNKMDRKCAQSPLGNRAFD